MSTIKEELLEIVNTQSDAWLRFTKIVRDSHSAKSFHRNLVESRFLGSMDCNPVYNPSIMRAFRVIINNDDMLTMNTFLDGSHDVLIVDGHRHESLFTEHDLGNKFDDPEIINIANKIYPWVKIIEDSNGWETLHGVRKNSELLTGLTLFRNHANPKMCEYYYRNHVDALLKLDSKFIDAGLEESFKDPLLILARMLRSAGLSDMDERNTRYQDFDDRIKSFESKIDALTILKPRIDKGIKDLDNVLKLRNKKERIKYE